MTSFVGRRQATADVKGVLSTSRLVTLTGVGGTGKSRLALHVAQELRRVFADGVWLVELAKLRDPSLLGDTVATALGLTDLSNRAPETVLASYLADKLLLLVLDNCEHLLGDCAHLVAKLLPAAPGLRVLVTSREPLGIRGENVWPVPPLSMPHAEVSLPRGDGWEHRYEALVLFEERAAAVVPGFTLNRDNERVVAQLCQRLDGLPLAIELAAVRLRSLSVSDMLARLEDRFRLLTGGDRGAPARHQTLRAAMEWSFDLCSELERTLWARLSVFAGGFDLVAAEDVCSGEGLQVEDVLTGVTGLVDKSVLTRSDDATPRARYRMLETIREFGQKRLAGEKDVAVRRRHRDYYLHLTEEAEADWFGPNQVKWLNMFQTEHPNLWAALEFCLTQPGETRAGLRMAGGLYWYWAPRNIRNGRGWLDRVLAADTAPSPERTKALWADGWITADQDTLYSLTLAEEVVDLAREFDDELAVAHALQLIGYSRWFQGELAEAAHAYEQALAHYRNVGAVDCMTAVGLGDLGAIVGMRGDTERAVALCQECVALCRSRGEQWAKGWGLWHLARVRWLQHDLPQADTNVREALRLKIALGDQLGIAWCVEILAWVAAAKDGAEHAARLFGMSNTLSEQIGHSLSGWPTGRDVSNQCIGRVREALGQRAFDAAFEQGRRLTGDEAMACALGELPVAPPPAVTTAPQLPQLTRREHEVAKLVAKGMSNKGIAATLVIAQRTAESHVEHILTKLGFTSRTQIAAWMTEQQHG